MRMMCRDVCRLNGRGSRCSFMSVSSCSSELPFLRLHSWQHATRFSHVDNPPRDRGTTWSSVSSPAVSTTPQYWHALRSHSKMFLRESARVWCGILRYSSSRITLGIATVNRAACSTAPCSSSVRATPFSTSTSARRAPQMLIGSYDAFSTSTGICITGWRKTPIRTSSSVVSRGEACPAACRLPLTRCFRTFDPCIALAPPVPIRISVRRDLRCLYPCAAPSRSLPTAQPAVSAPAPALPPTPCARPLAAALAHTPERLRRWYKCRRPAAPRTRAQAGSRPPQRLLPGFSAAPPGSAQTGFSYRAAAPEDRFPIAASIPERSAAARRWPHPPAAPTGYIRAHAASPETAAPQPRPAPGQPPCATSESPRRAFLPA